MNWKLTQRLISSLGIFLLLVPFRSMTLAEEPISASPESVIENVIDCREEQTRHHHKQINDLAAQADRAWRAHQLEQAAQAFGKMLLKIETTENTDIKAYLFAERVYGDNIAAEIGRGEFKRSLLHAIVAQAVATQQTEKVAKLLAQALHATHSLGEDSAALQAAELIELAKAYRLLQQPEQALGLLHQAQAKVTTLSGPEYRTLLLTRIAQEYQGLHKTDQAIASLNRSLQSAEAISPDNVFAIKPSSRIVPIVTGYVQAGALDLALSVAQRIPEASFQGEAIAPLVEHHLQNDQTESALQIAEAIEHKAIQAKMLTQVAGAYARANQPEQAEPLFNRAVEVAKAEPDEISRASALAEASLTYARAGQPDTAFAVATTIVDIPAQVTALAGIAAQYVEIGQSQTAARVLSQAIGQAQSLGDEGKALQTKLYHNYLEVEHYELALQALQGFYGEYPYLGSSLDRFVQAAAKAGEYQTALQAIAAMPADQPSLESLSLKRVATAYVQAGNYPNGLQTANAIADPATRISALSILISAHIEAGQAEQAMNLFEQTLQFSLRSTFSTPGEHTQALTDLAIQASKLGLTEQATALRQQALQLITTDESRENETNSDGLTVADALLSGIISQYLTAEQYDVALEMAQAITTPWQGRRLDQVLGWAIPDKRYGVAREAIQAMPSPEEKANALLMLADHFYQNGEQNRFIDSLAEAFDAARMIEKSPESLGQPPVEIASSPRSYYLRNIALHYAQAGYVKQAIDVADVLEENADRRELFIQRLLCYAETAA